MSVSAMNWHGQMRSSYIYSDNVIAGVDPNRLVTSPKETSGSWSLTNPTISPLTQLMIAIVLKILFIYVCSITFVKELPCATTALVYLF